MNKYEIFIFGIQKTIWADRMVTKENGQTFLYKKIMSKGSEIWPEEEIITVIPKEAFIEVSIINNKSVL